MFDAWLHDTVSALVYSLAGDHSGEGCPELQPPYNDLTRFILQQQTRLPDFLRLPMSAATLGFDFAAVFRSGRWFHPQSAAARAQRIGSWKHSKLGLKRDFIRYYESLATLALYSGGVGVSPAPFAATSPSIATEKVSTVPGAGRDGVEEDGFAGGQAFQNARKSMEPPGPVPAREGMIAQPPHELRCEIAVVGSGPGGAVTACLLAEAGRDVLLIEEGPFLQLESCVPFSRQEMEQKYRNGGQTVAMGRDKVAYVEGCCVGGGSEINSGLYHRTPPDILAHWRKAYAVEALGETDLAPHFEACERELSVSLMPGEPPPASLKLHEGARRLGWKSLEVPRWFSYKDEPGSAGTRQSMTKTFIPRFLRAGGKLLPRTRVLRINRAGEKWSLVGRHAGVGAIRIEAETLFLCGGAVQTPALLRRSGLGHHVGDSLRMHPTVKVAAMFPENVNSADMGVPVHQVKEFAPRLSFGCSISTPPYLALGLLEHPSCVPNVSRDWQRMANYYAMITGEGYGTIRPLSGFRDPLVRYRLSENDRRDLADGLRKLSELLFAAGAESLYPGVSGVPEMRSREALRKLPDVLPAGRSHLMTIHLFSSCAMGEAKNLCAVDSFGRVHGFKRLFVSDASLLCTAPGVNPQGTIMALARRNAFRFLNRL